MLIPNKNETQVLVLMTGNISFELKMVVFSYVVLVLSKESSWK